MALALYRKYRSKSLDEIVGQSHVTDVLRRALESGKIAHAYLLTGPRGVGKTSIARILAHEINKLPYTDESEHLDIIEIDAASNNGVDDVRELRDKARIAPTSAAKKIYIIDEVHMLSKPAFNALLKILEEPPEHIVFILATTDFDKLPDTIVSRTQRYHFHTISTEEISAHLTSIAAQEKIAIDDDALTLVATRGGGSLRDSLNLLDQIQHAAHDGTITAHDVELSLGLATSTEIAELIGSLQAGDAARIVSQSQAVQRRGVSATTLAAQLVDAITASLDSAPSLVRTLQPLMEVARSNYPDTQLLVALLVDASLPTRPTSAALTVSAPAAPSIAKPIPAPVVTKSVTPAPRAQPASAPMPTVVDNTPADLSKFNWQAILEHARTNHTALYAMLAKCTPELTDSKLILYTGRKFTKTKLDSAKYRPLLSQVFAATGVGAGLDVDTRETQAPPKDEQAAKIAAMMGGGEEVDVE